MDYKKLVDGVDAMACVVSVEKKKKDEYGEIRIVAGNQAYIDSITKAVDGVQMLKQEFVPNSLYTDYITRDLNFETYCYGAAVEKKCLNSYVHPERYDVWFHMLFIPLVSEEENLGYCFYIMEISRDADASQMSAGSEELAATVLEMSIKIDAATDFKVGINDVIKDIRKICGAQRCCILLTDPAERSCSVLCEDLSPDAVQKPIGTVVDDEFYSIVETWEDTIAGSNCLIVRNESEMRIVQERNPKWYEGLKENQVKSLVLFPLKFSGVLLGYIWATNFEAENAEKIKETLEVTTFILGSEIANYQLLNRLRILSARDLLTGVMNRNEMNGYVEQLAGGEVSEGRSVGVVFADLNGLKHVNDSEGHIAGDGLLKRAACALMDVFEAKTIFRAGGDEFTVILTDVTEEELEEKVNAFREAADRYDKVRFAVGWDLEADAKDVRKALQSADEKMYLDKEKFYQIHPEIMR